MMNLSVAVALALALVGAGCGDDGEGGGPAVPTPTPTPKEAPHPPHSIMRVGSTQPGGGRLIVDDTPTAFVVEAACLGGTGTHCDGGIVVYSGTSPGFNDLTADSPDVPIYILPEDIEVRIELTRVDSGASVGISGVTLGTVGAVGIVNMTGHLHNHPMWQIAAPGGVHPEDRHLGFRLHADGFQSSDEILLTLKLFEGEGDGDDDHDHD